MSKRPRLSAREKRWNRFLPGDRVRISDTHWSKYKGEEGVTGLLSYQGDGGDGSNETAGGCFIWVVLASGGEVRIDPVIGDQAELIEEKT